MRLQQGGEPPGQSPVPLLDNSSDSLAALAALEEAEYIEDHADEERMFSDFDKLLDDLKNALRRGKDIRPMVSGLGSKAEALSEHLVVHGKRKSMVRYMMEAMVGTYSNSSSRWSGAG